MYISWVLVLYLHGQVKCGGFSHCPKGKERDRLRPVALVQISVHTNQSFAVGCSGGNLSFECRIVRLPHIMSELTEHPSMVVISERKIMFRWHLHRLIEAMIDGVVMSGSRNSIIDLSPVRWIGSEA